MMDLFAGCFLPPPYVDEYGETDQGLRRGNPLHLCRHRYADLQSVWFHHGVPEKTAQLMDLHPGTFMTDWQHY